MKQIKTRKRSATFSLSLLVAAIPTLLTAQAGDLVTSYANGPGANSRISCSAVQVDGKLVIGGTFTGFAGTSRKRIARLTENGLLDTSFDPVLGPPVRSTRSPCSPMARSLLVVSSQATMAFYSGALHD
ncbi:MAG: delta-60 repeat domain-containing protein [Flavobacteriales bacterium]|nr:delta-60 repeat domain-containing protein [Flavobacteriales bacterium]